MANAPHDAGAEATWDQGPLDYFYCVIRLREDWPEWDRERLCRLLVHEWAHLAYYNHGPAMDRAMEPGFRECARFPVWADQLARGENRADNLRFDVRWFRQKARDAQRAKAQRRVRAKLRRKRERLVRVEGRIAELRALIGP